MIVKISSAGLMSRACFAACKLSADDALNELDIECVMQVSKFKHGK